MISQSCSPAACTIFTAPIAHRRFSNFLNDTILIFNCVRLRINTLPGINFFSFQPMRWTTTTHYCVYEDFFSHLSSAFLVGNANRSNPRRRHPIQKRSRSWTDYSDVGLSLRHAAPDSELRKVGRGKFIASFVATWGFSRTFPHNLPQTHAPSSSSQ